MLKGLLLTATLLIFLPLEPRPAFSFDTDFGGSCCEESGAANMQLAFGTSGDGGCCGGDGGIPYGAWNGDAGDGCCEEDDFEIYPRSGTSGCCVEDGAGEDRVAWGDSGCANECLAPDDVDEEVESDVFSFYESLSKAIEFCGDVAKEYWAYVAALTSLLLIACALWWHRSLLRWLRDGHLFVVSLVNEERAKLFEARIQGDPRHVLRLRLRIAIVPFLGILGYVFIMPILLKRRPRE